MSMPSMNLDSILTIPATYQLNSCTSLSPEGSLMELELMEQFDHSMSSDTFLGSDSYSQEGSPDASGSSSSDLEAFIFQEYSMPVMMAYGLPTTQSIDQSFKFNVMLPYPDTTLSLLESSKGRNNSTSQDKAPTAPVAAYFQSQAIRDWSGACSSGFSVENATSPISSSAHQDNMLHVTTEPRQQHVSQPHNASCNDWNAKNKLNLRVDTKMSSGFKYQDKLTANDYRNPLTPYSDSGNSSFSQWAPSFCGESNYSNNYLDSTTSLASFPVPSQLDVVDWLTSNIQYQHLTSNDGNFEALSTPSSAAFSALPTPTNTTNPPWTNLNPPSLMVDVLPSISNTTTNSSPPNFELATNFASIPSSSFQNFNQTSESITLNFSDNFDLQSFGEHNSSSQSPSTNFTMSSIFGHVASMYKQETSESLSNIYPLNQSPTHGSQVLATSMLTTTYPNRSKDGRKSKLCQPKVTAGESSSMKRRSTISSDYEKENIDPFRPRSFTPITSTPTRKNTLVGSRLKPGPKAKSTLIQHPPPTLNLIGLNPSKEKSGIPKDILKCLYETILDKDNLLPSNFTASINRRYICKLDGCGRSFPRKTAIESHLQTHLEDKPFVCHFQNCNAAFVRQHDLRRHQQIHSETKAFNCICGKGFARGDALIRHRQRGICIGGVGVMRR